MTAAGSPVHDGRPDSGTAVGLYTAALWFGLLGGTGQALLAAIQRYDLRHYTHLSRNVIWTAPLSSAVVLLLAAVPLWLAARLRPGPIWWRGAMSVYAALAALGILYYLSQLHPAARFVLAAGVGAAVGRLADDRRAGFSRLVRRSLPALSGLIVVAAAVLNTGWAVVGQRAIRTLPPAASGAPNVLLLILDTVRSIDLSLYDYQRNTSPALSRFAARGVVFDRAIAPAPWTLPSHAAIFTGLPAHELSADWRVPLDHRAPTLAEVLRERGYLTAGFAGNLAYASTESGLDRGFAHYEGFLLTAGNILASGMIAQHLLNAPFIRDLLDWHELVERKPAAGIHRRLVDWLAAHPGRPWFVFANFYDAHNPYLPRAPFDTAFTGRRIPSSARNFSLEHTAPVDTGRARPERDAYDQAIASLDHDIGLLLADLEARGALRNTLVIITADHGEEFGEHGLLSHGSSLYLPSLHVPLIIAFDGRVPAGRRVSGTVSLRDIAATTLDLAGAPATLPGHSLRPLWSDLSAVAHSSTPALAEVRYAPRIPAWFPAHKGDMSSLVTDTRQLVRDGTGAEEWFDLMRDPSGLIHAPADPALAGRLDALLPPRP